MTALSSFDPRLLILFLALYEERNVSRAAKRLGLSQPAVSHALNRLRLEFKDDLFIRAGRGVTPTPKAHQMKPKVDEVVRQILDLYSDQAPFDPKSEEGRIKIVTTDFFELLFLPTWFSRLALEAPKLQVVTRPSDGKLPKAELESGEVSLAIAGFFGALPEGFFHQKLFTEKYVCIVGKRNQKIQGKLGLREFCDLDHVLVSPKGDLLGIVDEALQKHKKKRWVRLGVSHFLVTAPLVVENDCVATVPERLAQKLQSYYPIQIFEPPVALPNFSIYQVWHGRTHRDPVHQWIRSRIVEQVRRETS